MTPIRARGGLDGLRAATRGRSPRVASPRAIQTTKGEVGGHPPAARGEDTKRTTHGGEPSPFPWSAGVEPILEPSALRRMAGARAGLGLSQEGCLLVCTSKQDLRPPAL